MTPQPVRLETSAGIEVKEVIGDDEVRVIVTAELDPLGRDCEMDEESVRAAVRAWLKKGGDPPLLLLVGCRVEVFGLRKVQMTSVSVAGSGLPPEQPGKPGTGTPEDAETPAPPVADQRAGEHAPGDHPAGQEDCRGR